MAKLANSWFQAKYIPWNYQKEVVRSPCSGYLASTSEGGDILIGNSATPTNNHIEIFEWLINRFETKGRRVIVPLSYGYDGYASRVCEYGTRLFGDSFVPLTTWISREDYFELLKSCHVAVFGHLRQQGAGNIYQMLRQGAHVFLHSANPLYRSLRDRGALVSNWDNEHRGMTGIEDVRIASDQAAINATVANQHLEFPPDFPRTSQLINAIL